jgi:malonyl-CoA decarboxylase
MAGADPASGMPRDFVFSTLSPVPGFTNWLQRRLADPAEESVLAPSEVCDLKGAWGVRDDAAVVERLGRELQAMRSSDTATAAVVSASGNAAVKGALTRLCARYLLLEKRKNRAVCPVANFHIRNGATLERINWGADLSPNGLATSCGLMVNYRYWLPRLELNHSSYVRDYHIARSDAVDALLKPSQASPPDAEGAAEA